MQGLLDDKFNERKNNITKGFSDDIEKGHGEGSRGGHIIGHTQSGKPIYSRSADTHKDFTAQDHMDASRANRRAANEHDDKWTNGGRHPRDPHLEQFSRHMQYAKEHEEQATKKNNIGPEHKVSAKDIGGTKGLFKHFVHNPDYMVIHHADDDKISVRHVASGRQLTRDEIIKMTKEKKK